MHLTTAPSAKILLCICVVFFFSVDTLSKTLDEIIITAQKRKQSLQDAPIALTVKNSQQLDALGITSLDGLMDGTIPSLVIYPGGSTPSNLTVTIRGDGPLDVGLPTRQQGVAIYTDGIYLGRAQGLNMELADVDRIEVLRGPQGTLFGRNATNGAVSIVSRKPTGEFGIRQTASTGSYDFFKAITRVNLPAFWGVSTKLDYVYSERGGWVKNRLAGQADYNEDKKEGVKLSVNWDLVDHLELGYAYDRSDINSAQVYLQLYDDPFNIFSDIEDEIDRKTTTRYPMVLDPTRVDLSGHTLIAQWEASDSITIKSLSSTRDVFENGFNNYGGTLDPNATDGTGTILDEDIEQEQYSQELQFIGEYNKFDWVTGLYYFKESSDFDASVLNALDVNYHPLSPPITVVPSRITTSDTTTQAIYSQGTLRVAGQFELTLGVRYTEDEKTAERDSKPARSINSDNIDGLIAINYRWSDDIGTYLKWSTAHKAGGYNPRSMDFVPFEEESNQTFELGLKSMLFNQRLRFNLAAFASEIRDKQFDFINPNNPLMLDTLNAVKDVDMSGLEVDVDAVVFDGLVLNLQYAYLDGDMPLQPHPGGGDPDQFALIQTPRHAGALSVDYNVLALPLGNIHAHLNITSTDSYAYLTHPESTGDSRTLLNARIALENVMIGPKGSLSFSLLGKNLTDEQYSSLRFPIGDPVLFTLQSFATPRTIAAEIKYEY